MYVDPITRQTYDFSTPIPCDNKPRNLIGLVQNGILFEIDESFLQINDFKV